MKCVASLVCVFIWLAAAGGFHISIPHTPSATHKVMCPLEIIIFLSEDHKAVVLYQ